MFLKFFVIFYNILIFPSLWPPLPSTAAGIQIGVSELLCAFLQQPKTKKKKKTEVFARNMAAPGIDTFGATVRVQIQRLRSCRHWTFVHMYIWSWTVLRCWRMARQQYRLWGSLTSFSTAASSPWEGELALEGCNGGCAPLRDPLGGSCSSALISSLWNLWNFLHPAGESPAQEVRSSLCHNMVTVAQA